MISSYSPEEVEFIASKLRDKFSASQIAKALSCERGAEVTRNMIIGIVARNHLLRDVGFAASPFRKGKVATKRKPRTTPAPKQIKPDKPHRPAIVRIISKPFKAPEPVPMFTSHAEYDAASRRVMLTELSRFECKWAVNDAAKGEDHLFCGLVTEPEKPWCAHHAMRAVGKGTESERRVDELVRKAAA